MSKLSKAIDDVSEGRDPITGAPDSHPAETGMGAAAYGTLGAVAGSVAGPVGLAAGAVVGSALGGAIGHGAGEDAERSALFSRIEPSLKESFVTRSYAVGHDFDDYRPAYEYGAKAQEEYDLPLGSPDLDQHLRRDWEAHGARNGLGFEQARPAIHDGWRAAAAFEASV